MNTFNERLKAARAQKKLKQNELADIINVSKSSISEWESGKHKPSTEQIPSICDALDVDPNWLFGEEYSKMLRETPADYYLLDDGSSLPKEAKKELDSFIEYLKMKYSREANKK